MSAYINLKTFIRAFFISGMFILQYFAVMSCCPISLFAADSIDSSNLNSEDLNSEESTLYSEKTLRKTQTISETIMSPYCPGRTLSSCPSDKARNLRNEISAFFERGYTEDAVLRQLTAKYGSTIRGEPESQGYWILAWVTPFLVIILFILAIHLLIRKYLLKSKGETTARNTDKTNNKLTAELEAELINRLKK